MLVRRKAALAHSRSSSRTQLEVPGHSVMCSCPMPAHTQCMYHSCGEPSRGRHIMWLPTGPASRSTHILLRAICKGCPAAVERSEPCDCTADKPHLLLPERSPHGNTPIQRPTDTHTCRDTPVPRPLYRPHKHTHTANETIPPPGCALLLSKLAPQHAGAQRHMSSQHI